MNDLFGNSTSTISSRFSTYEFNREQEFLSQVCTTHSSPPAARLPRILKIPLKDTISFPTRLIRLEFDHSTVQYYTEIDTVLLCGQLTRLSSIVSQIPVCLSSLNHCCLFKHVLNLFMLVTSESYR
jgi:hypothetical protein